MAFWVPDLRKKPLSCGVFRGFQKKCLAVHRIRDPFRMSSSSGWPLRSCKRWSYLLHGLKPWVVLQVHQLLPHQFQRIELIVQTLIWLILWCVSDFTYSAVDVFLSLMTLLYTSVYFSWSCGGVGGPDLAQSSLLGNLCFVSVVLCVNITLVFRQYSWCQAQYFDAICSWCLGMVLKCLYSCQELRQDVSRCFKCTFLDFQKSFPTSNSKVSDDHRLLRQQSFLPYSEYHCLCQWY